MYKVLSIDGGGIRGVIPAVVLKHIEQQKGKKIAEMFDLIVGTSTGGILAAGVSVKKSKQVNKPKYSADDLLKLYVDYGAEIFSRSFWDGITSGGGLLDEKYSADNLEKLLKKYFKEMTLRDVVKPVVITSYDIEARSPYFFKTVRAAEDPKNRNHRLRDVCRATSAAPTYFETAKTPTAGRQGPERALVDGGVFMNNPAAAGLVEAVKTGNGLDNIMVVSLGTGISTRPIPYEKAKSWGVAGWVKPVIDVMMDGQADAAAYQCGQLLPNIGAGDDQRYFRFDTRLNMALDDLDAANAGNIRNLMYEGHEILEEQADEVTRLLDKL